MITKEEREKLIKDWPNCGFKCKPDRPFSCGCRDCAAMKGYFEKGETESLFSPETIDWMMRMFDKRKGWLGDFGCLLAPAYRSGKCLKTDCHPWPQMSK